MYESERVVDGVDIKNDAHVSDSTSGIVTRKKDQVAFVYILGGNTYSLQILVGGRCSQRESELAVNVACESGTVESVGTLVSASVRFSKVFGGLVYDGVGNVDWRIQRIAGIAGFHPRTMIVAVKSEMGMMPSAFSRRQA